MRYQESTYSSVQPNPALCIASTDFLKMGLTSTVTVRRLLLCSVVVLLLVHRTAANPIEVVQARCRPGTARRNTCEKCAKVTHDDNAYDFCCTNVDDEQWCNDFINFTLSP